MIALTGRSADPGRRLVARTSRQIAVQTAVLFAVGVVALDVLTVAVVLNAEQRDAERQLSQATDDPDALTNPPVDIVVYHSDASGLRWSPGAPPGPLDPDGLRDLPAGDRVVRAAGRRYLVRTYRSGSTIVQVGLDLTRQERERARLCMGLVAAGAVGVVLAGGLGALIARRAIAPLGQAMRRQERFVADASHELRTPLTQLHTRAQLLQRDLRSHWDPDQVRADVEQLVRGTRQMGELVEELLVSAQLRFEPRRYGPVDLHRLANEVAEAEQPRALQRGVTLAAGCPASDGPGCAAGPGAGRVRGAEPALRRVLSSLVDNALTHTPAGGHVELWFVDAGDGFVEVRVRDDGEGFDPALSERMFERFYRGSHGDGRRFGLGLALAREVVLAHRGTLTAVSKPGGGACFVVRLPAWTEEDPRPD